MMNETELKEFAVKKLKSGYPPGELKIDLLNQGYSGKDVDAAITSQSIESKPNVFKISGWIVSGVLFVIIGLQQISSNNKFGYVLITWGAISAALKFILPSEKYKSLP